MNIGIIIPSITNYSGVQKFLCECIRIWEKYNDITLYTCNLNESILEEYEIDPEIILLNSKLHFSERYERISLPLEMKSLSKQIGNHDVINPHIFPSAFINKSPSVYIPHDPLRIAYDLYDYFLKRKDIPYPEKIFSKIYFPFLRWLDKKNTRFDSMISNSIFSKNYLEKVYDQKCDDVIYPGVDINSFKSNDPENFILVVNRLYPEKRVDVAIKTMQYLPSFNLKIVGDGRSINELKNLVHGLGLEDQVEFITGIDEITLKNLYSNCFCLIFTPIREPFGMVVLEAMAAGKPIIGCKVGGFTEIMKNQEHGFLVDVNPKIIANKIKFLDENNGIYKKMSRNCLKQAYNFPWKKTADEIMNIFKKYE